MKIKRNDERKKVMKLKKKTKILLSILLILIVVIIFLIIKNFHSSKNLDEAKIIESIDKYGYSLKDNKNSTYKKMFY